MGGNKHMFVYQIETFQNNIEKKYKKIMEFPAEIMI